MDNNIKSYKVTYRHPYTGAICKTAIFAESKPKAEAMARENSVIKRFGDGKVLDIWDVVSVEEWEG